MMSDLAIKVEGIGKRYNLGQLVSMRQSLGSLRRGLGSLFRPKDTTPASNEFWALRDVSFELRKGEALGVIGRNGAGKSTLLKILSRITTPTEGRAELFGRCGSLLEVGTGFNPELSGRDNVYLNGAILGMRTAEINRKFDDIVAFAEVDKFIDTPVKRYSSGMKTRLAFAVAAHLEPEVLIVDEVLAVGDAAFQRKCLRKMSQVAYDGRTILFVSHNMTAVETLCPTSIFLQHGRMTFAGPTNEAIAKYLDVRGELQSVSLTDRTDRRGNGAMKLQALEIRDEVGQPLTTPRSGQDIQIAVRYNLPREDAKDIRLSIVFVDEQEQPLFACNNELTQGLWQSLPPQGELICNLPRLPLREGEYSLNLQCEVDGIIADHVLGATTMYVESGDFYGSGQQPNSRRFHVLVPHGWQVQPQVAGQPA